MIEFQKPYKLHYSYETIQDVIQLHHVEGDGKYTKLCEQWINDHMSVKNTYMMTSCTHALESALKVIGLQPGDEVIVPSFTYPSTANAVILAGGTVVFGEVEEKYLTLDPLRLPTLITNKTKAIIVVHYGGVSCQMNEIMAIAKSNGLLVIEDAAQSFMTTYEDNYTGTIGDFGCFSFHGTKDFIAGEGGALIVNNPIFQSAVEIFRQKGTNRTAFLNGKSAFYEWIAEGSSYSPSEVNMAMLYSQLKLKTEILNQRRKIYEAYRVGITPLLGLYGIEDQITISSKEVDLVNGHLFFLIFKDKEIALEFSQFLYGQGVETRTHFVPLHESYMGKKFIRVENDFSIEKDLGKRLIRLPIYPDLGDQEVELLIKIITQFFEDRFTE